MTTDNRIRVQPTTVQAPIHQPYQPTVEEIYSHNQKNLGKSTLYIAPYTCGQYSVPGYDNFTCRFMDGQHIYSGVVDTRPTVGLLDGVATTLNILLERGFSDREIVILHESKGHAQYLHRDTLQSTKNTGGFKTHAIISGLLLELMKQFKDVKFDKVVADLTKTPYMDNRLMLRHSND